MPRFRWLRVVSALVIREMATRFGRSSGGYIWAILEPLGGIALLSIAFSLALRKPPLALPGYTLSIAWHQRTAHDAAHRWVREQILAVPGPPAGHQRRR